MGGCGIMAGVGVSFLLKRNAVAGAIPGFSHVGTVEYEASATVENPQFVIGDAESDGAKPVVRGKRGCEHIGEHQQVP